MRSSADFRTTVRRGLRAARPSVVVHMRLTQTPTPATHLDDSSDDVTRVGFVVSKAVGKAHMRNRVKRRLRHLSRPFVDAEPTGLQVVVRALPPAATAGDELGSQFESAWRSARSKLDRVTHASSEQPVRA